MADNAVMMAELSKIYEQRWYNAEQERLKIEGKIDNVKEPYRTLLHKRYIKDLSWEGVACEMNYSCDRVKHMHGEALRLYEVSTF